MTLLDFLHYEPNKYIYLGRFNIRRLDLYMVSHWTKEINSVFIVEITLLRRNSSSCILTPLSLGRFGFPLMLSVTKEYIFQLKISNKSTLKRQKKVSPGLQPLSRHTARYNETISFTPSESGEQIFIKAAKTPYNFVITRGVAAPLSRVITP